MKISKKIKSPISEELKSFERQFFNSVSSKIILLDLVLKYILKRKGKQIRPILVILFSKMFAKGKIPSKTYKIIKGCEKYSNGSPCFIFAKKRRIVWKNGGEKVKIKRKDLKSPYVVAKKIQDGGFYDGDISKLAGIDITTGQISDDTNITGAKESNTTQSNNNNDIVKELETLTKLYESGTLTKEEFEKAKNKLLNN